MRRNSFVAAIFAFLSILSLFPLPFKAQSASSANSCKNGYVVIYYNGIRTDPVDALKDLKEIRRLIGDTYNSEPVSYDFAYNPTSGEFRDIVETYQQRAAELDTSGTLSSHWELFWESFQGTSDVTSTLDRDAPTVRGVLQNIQSFLQSKLVSYLVSEIVHPTESEAVYAKHNRQLDYWVSQNKKILLFGHSQGNLFLNHAYDYITSSASVKASAGSVQAVQIAPASRTLRASPNEYVLSDDDVVINGLRTDNQIGRTGVPGNTVLYVPDSSADELGHSLTRIYLSPTTWGTGDPESLRDHVNDAVQTAMAALKSPPCQSSMRFTYDSLAFTDFYQCSRTGVVNCAVPSGNVHIDVTFKNMPSDFTGTVDGTNAGIYIDKLELDAANSQFMWVGTTDMNGCFTKAASYFFRLSNGAITDWDVEVEKDAARNFVCTDGAQTSFDLVLIYSQSTPYWNPGIYDEVNVAMLNSSPPKQYIGGTTSPAIWVRR